MSSQLTEQVDVPCEHLLHAWVGNQVTEDINTVLNDSLIGQNFLRALLLACINQHVELSDDALAPVESLVSVIALEQGHHCGEESTHISRYHLAELGLNEQVSDQVEQALLQEDTVSFSFLKRL